MKVGPNWHAWDPWRSKSGTLSGFLTYILLQNIKKKLKGGPFEDYKIFKRKVTLCRI